MKFLYLCIAFMFLLISCAPKIIPLTRDVTGGPYIAHSNSNKDVVWDKIIDLFAQKGLPIKIIDRSSGLIISDRSLFPITIEKKDGSLKDSTAYFVIPKMKNQGSGKYEPAFNDVSGEWNIRIKEDPAGGTSININIVNMKYAYLYYNSKVPQDKPLPSYKSTGVFENMVTEQIQ